MSNMVCEANRASHAARYLSVATLALVLAACGGGGSSTGSNTGGGSTGGGSTGGGSTGGGSTGGGSTGGSGSGGYTAPAILGQLTVTGSGAAQYAATFTPSSLQPVTAGTSTSLKWIDANSRTLMVAGMTASATNGNLQWQKLPASNAELTFDAVAGSVTFNNLATTSATGGATGALTLSGTLNFAPLNSGPVTITGANTAHTGSGFNAPAATYALANGMEDHVWTDTRGTSMTLTRVVADGTTLITFFGLGGRSYVAMGAVAADIGVTVNTAAKTVTFSNTTLTSTLDGSSAILNGTLTTP